MNTKYNEYTNSYVQSNADAYVNIVNYNQQSVGYTRQGPDIPYTITKAVSNWNSWRPFETLVRGANCSGYSTIQSAYTYGNKNSSLCSPKYEDSPC